MSEKGMNERFALAAVQIVQVGYDLRQLSNLLRGSLQYAQHAVAEADRRLALALDDGGWAARGSMSLTDLEVCAREFVTMAEAMTQLSERASDMQHRLLEASEAVWRESPVIIQFKREAAE